MATVSPPLQPHIRKHACSRNGRPSELDWELYKPEIMRLYHPQSKLHLKQIVEKMRRDHGFKATEAMYKKRLKRWGAARNVKRSKMPSPTPTAPMGTHYRCLHEAGCLTTAQLCHNFHYDTDSSAAREATVDSEEWSMVSLCDRPGSASQTSTATSQRSLLTKRSWLSSPPCMPSDLSPSQRSGICVSSGTTAFDNADWPCENVSVPYRAVLERSETRAVSTESLNGFDLADTHLEPPNILLRPYSVAGTNASPTHASPVLFRHPSVQADPTEFVNASLQYCTLQCDGSRPLEAETAAARASTIFFYLIAQSHQSALTALSAVTIILSMFDQDEEALTIVINARKAAMSHLSEDNPVVQTINYMQLQAGGKFSVMTTHQLQSIYNSFCAWLPEGHPYTLVAGYQLAWRLSADPKDGKHVLDALRMLGQLQGECDFILGATHLLSLAVLMTKSRVLQALDLPLDALPVMTELIRRMNLACPPCHPYLLEARSRYAPLLFYAYRDQEAEHEWTAAALGKAEIFGRAHPITRKSIQSVEDFFFDTVESPPPPSFYLRLDAAQDKYRGRRPDILTLHRGADHHSQSQASHLNAV